MTEIPHSLPVDVGPGETLSVPIELGSPPPLPPVKTRSERLRSWLLWNVHCRRGRGCADVVADVVTVPGDPVLKLQYNCGGCHSDYRWDSLTRTRVRL